uniref:Endothelin-converting enzyme-like protein 1 n=1 Tax=Ampulex compressa TaxID=860918 RepID=A0A1W6EVV0_AMPCP|nr:endothelin-converting enzyme-like protein 1 [Ampulex compressa]
MGVSRKEYISTFMAGLQVAFLLGGFFSLTTAVRVCDTEACNRLSTEIRSNMNTSVDPCDNFFQYACGGWIAAHPVPDGARRFSRLHVMYQELQDQLRELLEEPIKPTDNSGERAAKQHFQLCINETASGQNMVRFLSIVGNVGLWPMIRGSGTVTRTWQQIHDEYNWMTGKPSLYTITVYSNETGSTSNSLFLDQPESFFDVRLERKNADNVIKYVNFLVNVVSHFATVAGLPISEEKIRQDVQNVYDFRDKLEELRTKFLFRKRGPVMSIIETQQFLNNATAGVQQIDVSAAMQAAYRSVKDVTVTQDELIHVREPSYLQGLAQLLANTSEDIILNHINLHFVENHMIYTNAHLRHLLDEMYGSDDDRLTYCTNMPNIQVALSSMYVKKYFSAEKRAAAINITENIKTAVKNQASRTGWLSTTQLHSSFEKINKMNYIIGYVDAIVNDTQVEAYYAEYNMDGNYLQNILNYEGVEYSRLLRKLRHPTTDELKKRPQEWPIKVTSLYRTVPNQLEIAAGLLKWPMFDVNLPNVANYATTGVIIGHLLASMFDSVGFYLDQAENYTLPMNQPSDDAHYNRTACFELQYTNYVRNLINGTGKKYNHYNSFLTQTTYESFGLSVAKEAYDAQTSSEGSEFTKLPNLDEFNHEKQFFLAFAGSQCESICSSELYNILRQSAQTTNEVKVNSAVLNLPAFAETFNCPLESPMNPSNKCFILDPPRV